jgi:hypothetical protein
LEYSLLTYETGDSNIYRKAREPAQSSRSELGDGPQAHAKPMGKFAGISTILAYNKSPKPLPSLFSCEHKRCAIPPFLPP